MNFAAVPLLMLPRKMSPVSRSPAKNVFPLSLATPSVPVACGRSIAGSAWRAVACGASNAIAIMATKTAPNMDFLLEPVIAVPRFARGPPNAVPVSVLSSLGPLRTEHKVARRVRFRCLLGGPGDVRLRVRACRPRPLSHGDVRPVPGRCPAGGSLAAPRPAGLSWRRGRMVGCGVADPSAGAGLGGQRTGRTQPSRRARGGGVLAQRRRRPAGVTPGLAADAGHDPQPRVAA